MSEEKLLYKSGCPGVYSMEAQQIMKTVIKSFGILVISAAICLGGSAKRQAAVWDSLKDPETAQQLKAFVAEKQGQASVLAEADEKEYANDNFKFKRTDCQPFFTAVNKGNWQVVSNLFSEMQNRLWSQTTTVERRGRWWQCHGRRQSPVARYPPLPSPRLLRASARR